MENETDINMLRAHIAALRAETPCSRNGLIAYTYNDGIHEKGYYSATRTNIGDYIQSVAARQFLPRVDAYVDRDRLALYDGAPVNMIMNA